MIHVLSTPVFYSIELTPVCDNRCTACSNVFIDDKRTRANTADCRYLALEQWRLVFDKLSPHAHRLKLTGGEPTLHPEFEGIVRHVASLDIPFTIFTNARWHSPQRLIDLIKPIPQFGGFLVSLHGACASSHEAFTGVVGSFDEAVENIQRAVAQGLPVTTSTVFTQVNLNELRAIADLSLQLGAHHAVFNRYLGMEIPGMSLSADELIQATRMVDQMKSDGKPVKFGVCIPQCMTPNGNGSNGCLAGVAYCAIDPWGNLRPCNHSNLLCGNLLTQSLAEAWQSSEMDRFRNAISIDCHTCDAFSSCHGGCKALAMEFGIAQDPLMQRPIHRTAVADSPIIQLGATMRPIPKYQVREEGFGYVITRGNAILSVRSNAKSILDAFDGTTTLIQLRDRFGTEALSLVALMYQKGLVELLN